jgi:N6-adenosine-specific RNA methylase IME4
VQEWTWVKVTSSGLPVTALTGSWRKPFETLLLGKLLRPGKPVPSLSRKIIIATPDVHSRKPNIRQLLEADLPANYKGLEVFARNLTAGWWAWGDEVLKFQHMEHWTKDTKP